MTAVDEAFIVALTEEYIDQLGRLAGASGAMVREVFLALEHLNRSDVDAFRRDATPILRAARAEAIDLTSGYLSEATGGRLSAGGLAEVAPDVTAPLLRTWHQLKQGEQWEQARESGASQAEAVGHDHAQQGASDRMARPGTKVRGYRRVLSPNACEWCTVVSTQMYRSAESARFGHHKCRCTVVAVPLSGDPAHAINKARLRELKASGAVGRVSAARTRSRG